MRRSTHDNTVVEVGAVERGGVQHGGEQGLGALGPVVGARVGTGVAARRAGRARADKAAGDEQRVVPRSAALAPVTTARAPRRGRLDRAARVVEQARTAPSHAPRAVARSTSGLVDVDTTAPGAPSTVGTTIDDVLPDRGGPSTSTACSDARPRRPDANPRPGTRQRTATDSGANGRQPLVDHPVAIVPGAAATRVSSSASDDAQTVRVAKRWPAEAANVVHTISGRKRRHALPNPQRPRDAEQRVRISGVEHAAPCFHMIFLRWHDPSDVRSERDGDLEAELAVVIELGIDDDDVVAVVGQVGSSAENPFK